jgi:formylglycine-generating enzyme
MKLRDGARKMKTALQAVRIGLSIQALGAGVAAFGQPAITSFSGNGVLVCSNLEPGSVASVEWASSLSGPWQTNWAGLDAVAADTNGMIQVIVPMFYRVRGTNSVPPGMAPIPAGSFTMGDALDGEGDALPLHTNYVGAFYMDVNLVSYSQWQSVYSWATNHGYGFDYAGSGKAANHPVQTIDWYECVKWCNARSQQAGLTPVYYTDAGLTQVYTNGQAAPYVNWAAKGYRLPTEAEWEKAARGGASGHRFPWPDANTINWNRANYEAETGFGGYDVNPTSGYDTNFTSGGIPCTSPVGSFAPNGYGLYDMAGNLWEWCWDWYDSAYYSSSPGPDPRGPASSPSGGRVLRGGSWTYYADGSRCAFRGVSGPGTTGGYSFGFRCVRGF